MRRFVCLMATVVFWSPIHAQTTLPDGTCKLVWNGVVFRFSTSDAATSSVSSPVPVDRLVYAVRYTRPVIECSGRPRSTAMRFQLVTYDAEFQIRDSLFVELGDDQTDMTAYSAMLDKLLAPVREGWQIRINRLHFDSLQYAGYFGLQAIAADNPFTPNGGMFRLVKCYTSVASQIIQLVPADLADSVNWYKPSEVGISFIDSLINTNLIVYDDSQSHKGEITAFSFQPLSTAQPVYALAQRHKHRDMIKLLRSCAGTRGTLRIEITANNKRHFAILNIETGKRTLNPPVDTPVAAASLLPRTTHWVAPPQTDPVVSIGHLVWPHYPAGDSLGYFIIETDILSFKSALAQPLNTKSVYQKLSWQVSAAKVPVSMPFRADETDAHVPTPMNLVPHLLNHVLRQGSGSHVLFTLHLTNGNKIVFGVRLT